MLSNMDHHRIYKDLPLNENAFSTRLLTTLPGSGDDPLVCRLRSADINAYATYDALSYTWGDHNDKRMILVNAEPFSVTTNLEDALRALRLSDRPRELWVDAICINQADLQEKAAQIPEMGHIYRNAHRVVIWLGKRNEYTDYAINVAKADTTAMHLRWSVKTKQYEDDPHLDLQSSKQGEAFAKGLEDLLLRPWWTRVWVVQEVAMAYSDPLITCGNASVPWRSFVKCIANYERFSSLSINDGCGLPRRKNNYQLRQ